jgi:hypothetical protein
MLVGAALVYTCLRFRFRAEKDRLETTRQAREHRHPQRNPDGRNRFHNGKLRMHRTALYAVSPINLLSHSSPRLDYAGQREKSDIKLQRNLGNEGLASALEAWVAPAKSVFADAILPNGAARKTLP